MTAENRDTVFHESESKSLPVHVGRCEERYRTLFNRLGRIEKIQLLVAAGVGSLLLTVMAGVLISVIQRGLAS